MAGEAVAPCQSLWTGVVSIRILQKQNYGSVAHSVLNQCISAGNKGKQVRSCLYNKKHKDLVLLHTYKTVTQLWLPIMHFCRRSWTMHAGCYSLAPIHFIVQSGMIWKADVTLNEKPLFGPFSGTLDTVAHCSYFLWAAPATRLPLQNLLQVISYIQTNLVSQTSADSAACMVETQEQNNVLLDCNRWTSSTRTSLGLANLPKTETWFKVTQPYFTARRNTPLWSCDDWISDWRLCLLAQLHELCQYL